MPTGPSTEEDILHLDLRITSKNYIQEILDPRILSLLHVRVMLGAVHVLGVMLGAVLAKRNFT